MLMLNVPATVGLMVLAAPIIGLLFEHGSFTAADTSATARALVFYAPGLVGYSAVKIAAPTFYALHESRTPVIVSMATVGLNLGLNVVLVQVIGYRGLALGTALAAIFNAGTLLFVLRRRLGGIDGARIAVALLKVVLASGLMGVAAWAAAALAVRPAGDHHRGCTPRARWVAGLLRRSWCSALPRGPCVLPSSTRRRRWCGHG